MSDVDLGPELEEAVAGLIGSGRYASREQVFREGVRLLRERESQLAELDRAIDAGLADARAGRVTPADEVFDRLQAKYERMALAAECPSG